MPDAKRAGGPLVAGLVVALLAGHAFAGPLGLPVAAPPLVQLAQSADELPPQMRRALIVGIQEELLEHGYDAGPVDGLFGARTRGAIRKYQRDAHLPVKGVPTKDLLDHLKFAQPQISAGAAAATVAPAASARAAAPRAPKDLVTAVQRELQVRGYYRDKLDGVIGPNTRGAVRAFQRDAGFPVTGEVDERLLAELRTVDADIKARGGS